MKAARRAYVMRARADAAAQTGRRILQAVHALLAELPYERITIAAVAARAGVSGLTVVRRYGSRDGLVDAAVDAARAEIVAQRGAAPAGDAAAAVANLFDHYERWGRAVTRLLEQEEQVPRIAALAREGRATHAAWVARVFEPALRRVRGRARERLRTQLVAATDVYVWKLLRRDLGLPRDDAEASVLGMAAALCAAGGE
jgi:AcrR family transcriptional regulator